MVSIILTCFRGERYIRQALASIQQQSFQDFEVLVIDEYGEDATREIAEAWEGLDIRYFRKSDEGPGAAVFFGLEQCAHELVAIFEQDDLWYPQKLEKQVAAFAMKPALALVSTDWCYGATPPDTPVSTLQEFEYTDSGDAFTNLLRANYIVTSSVMLRKSVVEEVGYPDVTGIVQGPWDRQLWLRIANRHPIEVLREILVWKYVSAENLSISRGIYAELQFLGWQQALETYKEPQYQEMIRRNLAVTARSAAIAYLARNDFDRFKERIRTAESYDSSMVRGTRHHLLARLPNPVIGGLKKLRDLTRG